MPETVGAFYTTSTAKSVRIRKRLPIFLFSCEYLSGLSVSFLLLDFLLYYCCMYNVALTCGVRFYLWLARYKIYTLLYLRAPKRRDNTRMV